MSSVTLSQNPLFSEYRHDADYEQSAKYELWTKTDPMLSMASICFLAVNMLNQMHNKCAEETGFVKALQTIGIEVGLFASSFILAPIETITRLALAIIFAVPAGITMLILGQNFFSDIVFTCLGIGSILSGDSIASGAVSLFTNVAYSDKEIDYIGQAEKYLNFYNPNENQPEQERSDSKLADPENSMDYSL